MRSSACAAAATASFDSTFRSLRGSSTTRRRSGRAWAGAAEAAVLDSGVRAADLHAIGITNQRETTLLWERGTGRPVHRAIVWQDRRTAARCRELPAGLIRARTGL